MKKIIVTIDDDGSVDIEGEITAQEAGAIANEAVSLIKEGAFIGNFVSVSKEHSLWGMLDSDEEKMFPVETLIENIDSGDIEPSKEDLERMSSCGIDDIVLGEA